MSDLFDPAATNAVGEEASVADAVEARWQDMDQEASDELARGQLRTHLTDFMAAYNFARSLKTLNGLTPYEYICKIWTSEPDRFILNPIHQMPGLNT